MQYLSADAIDGKSNHGFNPISKFMGKEIDRAVYKSVEQLKAPSIRTSTRLRAKEERNCTLPSHTTKRGRPALKMVNPSPAAIDPMTGSSPKSLAKLSSRTSKPVRINRVNNINCDINLDESDRTPSQILSASTPSLPLLGNNFSYPRFVVTTPVDFKKSLDHDPDTHKSTKAVIDPGDGQLQCANYGTTEAQKWTPVGYTTSM
ncbi:hypothetical protein DXG01_015517 [Tephrocybe rancida]|nr:hypothetical protein DXG01_015517 [Tephrocybe rancida]